MLPAKNLMKRWHTAMHISTGYRVLACVSLLFMAPGVDPTWRYLNLQKKHSRR